MCGAYRWSVKTGADPDVGSVNPLPKLTTIANLVGLSAPATTPSNGRVSPVETTIYEIRNVTMTYIRMADDDSDYHHVITDGTHTTIIETPFPGCVNNSSPWLCRITRARAVDDARYAPTINAQFPDVPVSVVGIGFWDELHGQVGVAPNGIELHPILAICYGQDCDPYAP
jgi:hypothetical protein